jgi:hypothetical protein
MKLSLLYESIVYHGTVRSALADRHDSVFVTTDPHQASRYAAKAAKVNGGDPVVIEIEIPPGVSLRQDEAGGSRAFMVAGGIAPEWIRRIYELDYENDRLVPQARQ